MNHDEQKPQPVMLHVTRYLIQAMLLACISVIYLVYHQFMQKVKIGPEICASSLL